MSAPAIANHPELQPGGMVYFPEDRRGFRIVARSERFLIAWKPHPGSYMYTIVDFQEKRRGPDNYVFSPGDYNTAEGAAVALKALEDGSMEVSSRHDLPLRICTKQERGSAPRVRR